MITIWHNPKCATSRTVLGIIRASGAEPEIVDYQQTPPSRDTIRQWAAAAGLSIREILRERNTPYAELGLDDPALTDDHLLDAIEAHPILLNRPFVRSPKGTRLCRPSERVFDLLDAPPAGFSGETGG